MFARTTKKIKGYIWFKTLKNVRKQKKFEFLQKKQEPISQTTLVINNRRFLDSFNKLLHMTSQLALNFYFSCNFNGRAIHAYKEKDKRREGDL